MLELYDAVGDSNAMFIILISTSPNFQHFWHDIAPNFHKMHGAAFLVPDLIFYMRVLLWWVEVSVILEYFVCRFDCDHFWLGQRATVILQKCNINVHCALLLQQKNDKIL